MLVYIWQVDFGLLCRLLLTNTLDTDAVPKKRGPKTDVLESLLKRVDGLEAQLREKNDQTSPTAVESTAQVTKEEDDPVEPAQKRIAVETSIPPATGEPTTISPLAPATAISKLDYPAYCHCRAT